MWEFFGRISRGVGGMLRNRQKYESVSASRCASRRRGAGHDMSVAPGLVRSETALHQIECLIHPVIVPSSLNHIRPESCSRVVETCSFGSVQEDA